MKLLFRELIDCVQLWLGEILGSRLKVSTAIFVIKSGVQVP